MSENKVLSREDIIAMEPGRELDSVVMKTIFNASENYYGEGELWFHYDTNGEPDYEWSCYFSPSTDISAAWEVVEKLQERFLVSIYANPNNVPGELFTVHISKTAMSSNFVEIDSSTAPEAICKAALLAVME